MSVKKSTLNGRTVFTTSDGKFFFTLGKAKAHAAKHRDRGSEMVSVQFGLSKVPNPAKLASRAKVGTPAARRAAERRASSTRWERSSSWWIR